VKADHHCQVALAQDARKEAHGSFLFGTKSVRFAPAGVNQKAERDRQGRFSGKKGNLLLCAVFGDLEIALLEVGNDLLGFLVTHGREQVDQIDLYANAALLQWV